MRSGRGADKLPVRQGVFMTDPEKERTGKPHDASYPEPIRTVLDALDKLRFGAIQLTVHEGKLVQVDVTERKRFSN
jgi:hypothetical protein